MGGINSTNAYSGLAAYGRFQALVSAIGGTVIGIIFAAVGYYMTGLSPPPKRIQATAVVKDISCEETGIRLRSIICTGTVDLTLADGKVQTTAVTNLPKSAKVGETLSVFYSPTNTFDVSFIIGATEVNLRAVGFLFLLIGLGAIALVWVQYYAARTFKPAAAAAGASSLAGTAREIMSDFNPFR